MPVECFGGFILLNPDSNAAPLADFLGPAKDILAAYRMEEWVAVGVNEPHPSGDRNRCVWLVIFLHWLPPEERAAKRAPVRTIPEGEHFPYHWVLEQDFEQMPIQLDGLRNRLYRDMALTKCEPRVAHFQGAIESWVE